MIATEYLRISGKIITDLLKYLIVFVFQLEHAHIQLIGPLEKFRKVQIAAAKVGSHLRIIQCHSFKTFSVET